MSQRARLRRRRDPASAARNLWINRWCFTTLVFAGITYWYGYARWLPVVAAFSLSVLLLKHWTDHARREAHDLALRLGSVQDDPHPGHFEERIVLLLRDLGWTDVQRTGQTGDGGVDVRGFKDGQPWIVQCKRYAASNTVGEPTLRDFYGTLIHEGVAGGLFVTSSSFTAQAQRWVAGKPIVLWDAVALGHQIAATAPDVSVQRARARRRWTYRASGLIVLVACAIIASTVLGGMRRVPAGGVQAVAEQPRMEGEATRAPLPPTSMDDHATPRVQPLTATLAQDGNLRAAPTTRSAVLHVVRTRTAVQLLGRDASSTWLRVQLDSGEQGWLHRSLLAIDVPQVQSLAVDS